MLDKPPMIARLQWCLTTHQPLHRSAVFRGNQHETLASIHALAPSHRSRFFGERRVHRHLALVGTWLGIWLSFGRDQASRTSWALSIPGTADRTGLGIISSGSFRTDPCRASRVRATRNRRNARCGSTARRRFARATSGKATRNATPCGHVSWQFRSARFP
jgi:hypothetical protein